MSPPLLLALAALIVALKTWHGWKLGAVRQAIGLAALALGAGAAVLGGPIAEPFLDLSLPIPDEARVPVAGLGLGLLVYIVVTFFAAILFKTTEHQTVGVIRFGYGFLGAALGAITGAVLAAVLIVIVSASQGNTALLDDLRAGDFPGALRQIFPSAKPQD